MAVSPRDQERKRRMQSIIQRYGTNRECSGNPERWDARRNAIHRMLEETTDWVPPLEQERLSHLASEDTGMKVYFIQGETGGPIKIGVAVNVRERVALLQAGSPVILRVLGTQCGGRMLESELHRHFGSQRLHGEWFAPCAELLAYIASLSDE